MKREKVSRSETRQLCARVHVSTHLPLSRESVEIFLPEVLRLTNEKSFEFSLSLVTLGKKTIDLQAKIELEKSLSVK